MRVICRGMNTPPFSCSRDLEVLSLSGSSPSSFSSCAFKFRRDTFRKSLCEFDDRGVVTVVVMAVAAAVVVLAVTGIALLPTSWVPADFMDSLGFWHFLLLHRKRKMHKSHSVEHQPKGNVTINHIT